MLRSPSHESVTTDLSLFSVSSLASDAKAPPATTSPSARPPSSSSLRVDFRASDGSIPGGGRSPTPEHHSSGDLLAPPPGDPSRRRCGPQGRRPGSSAPRAPPPAVIPELLWFEEEETELMRSCAALSSALGLQKSFSTGDILGRGASGPWDDDDAEWWGAGGARDDGDGPAKGVGAKGAVSEEALLGCGAHRFLLHLQGGSGGTNLVPALLRCPLHRRLDAASRSCSTWVAVGDAVSQLPSPHGGGAAEPPPATTAATTTTTAATATTTTTASSAAPPDVPAPRRPPAQQHSLPPPPSSPPFAPADLIRSVNKKVRQGYIRRRLLATFRALERLSRGEFGEPAATEVVESSVGAKGAPEVVTLQGPVLAVAETSHPASPSSSLLRVPGSTGSGGASSNPQRRVSGVSTTGVTPGGAASARNLPLTIRDVERERGKPLSKYERNMMIFDWLHTLDDASFEGLQ
ncbi:actin cytoskeleton-regulatory complex protein pan-1-like [Ischnura elegans]|uniref:actin cytoskeleton-regulatory complex protein pan-1-like n=1 Tax=Ischnura elegans TaxID=197161 RepID=UPI001ED8A677|nr:actin cytoskeleton-regulatory complex protein pan-1-like [Ischnura elegans]